MPMDAALIREIRSSIRGVVLERNTPGFDRARSVYNAMIDRRPSLIVRCTTPSDVMGVVSIARREGLCPSVRGGGHSVAGFGVGEDQLMLDLSMMKSVRVLPEERRAHAGPGVTWAEFDAETERFGLATPGGIVSSTGIAGLTLGGGVGWLVRKYGLACDNLVSAEVVMADGELLTASEVEMPDLFWALRGAGANFGIVTRFEYRLHPVEAVTGGMLLYSRARAHEVLRFYREFVSRSPDAVTASAGLLTSSQGMPLVAIVVCYAGPDSESAAVLAPLRKLGPPGRGVVRRMPYTEMQSLMDEAFPWGRRNYWKSNYLKALSDEALDILIDFAATMPSPTSAILLECYGGAASRVGSAETAFPHRSNQFNMHALSNWSDVVEDERNIGWTQALWKSIRPYSSGSVYLNLLGEEGEQSVREAFGGNYERLAALKERYDPKNFFRSCHNIRPVALGVAQ